MTCSQERRKKGREKGRKEGKNGRREQKEVEGGDSSGS